jgi:exonuclease-1
MKQTTDRDCLAKLRTEAIACLQKGLSVTAEVERHTIAAMRRLGITVIVAPYEADAQLAYLCHIGVCDAVMTEDSDLILYSVISGRNFPILYKFNTSGSSHYFESNKMFNADTTDEFAAEATGRRSKFLPGLKDFRGASGRRMFVQMCVLAGCDYNDSVHGVGLQTAQQVRSCGSSR